MENWEGKTPEEILEEYKQKLTQGTAEEIIPKEKREALVAERQKELEEELSQKMRVLRGKEINLSDEDCLIKIFEENWQANQESPEAVETQAEIIDEEEEKEIFDERGNLKDQDYAETMNINYEEDSFILHKLQKIGGEKTTDFLIRHLPGENFLSLYYRQVFKLMDGVGAEYSSEKILNLIAGHQEKEKIDKRCILLLTDLIGAEGTREKLNKLIDENRTAGNQEADDNLEYARSFITPNHDKIAIENLRKFYQEKIKFEEYEINRKMNEREVKLLEGLMGGGEKVLEMGCGTGRLLLELKKAGYDVTGFDYTPRHIAYVKKQDEEAKVFQGDWHDNAIKDQSFDAIYSLGRNISHDYSLPDQARLFREAERILTGRGRFIFDIPNRERGGYKQMVEEYKKEMESRGIKNFRYGAIYDSPDGKNFATRYVYSHQDIGDLTRLTGFKISDVKKEPLETGRGDENLYYVLEKINRPCNCGFSEGPMAPHEQTPYCG